MCFSWSHSVSGLVFLFHPLCGKVKWAVLRIRANNPKVALQGRKLIPGSFITASLFELIMLLMCNSTRRSSESSQADWPRREPQRQQTSSPHHALKNKSSLSKMSYLAANGQTCSRCQAGGCVWIRRSILIHRLLCFFVFHSIFFQLVPQEFLDLDCCLPQVTTCKINPIRTFWRDPEPRRNANSKC